MSFTKFLIAALSATSIMPGAIAAVLPHEGHIEGRQCTGCAPPMKDNYCPKIDTEEPFTDEPWTTGNSAESGGTVSVQKSYAVGSSWSIGGDLGLGFEKLLEMSATLSASVSVSFEESTAIGVEYECPDGGDFFCSLNVRYGLMRVKGKIENIGPIASCEWGLRDRGGDFEAVLPRKDDAGNSVFEAKLCKCCGMPDSDNELVKDKECCADPCAGGKKMVRSGEKIRI